MSVPIPGKSSWPELLGVQRRSPTRGRTCPSRCSRRGRRSSRTSTPRAPASSSTTTALSTRSPSSDSQRTPQLACLESCVSSRRLFITVCHDRDVCVGGVMEQIPADVACLLCVLALSATITTTGKSSTTVWELNNCLLVFSSPFQLLCGISS